MATGTLASKAGKLVILAAIGTVCIASIISKDQLGFIFKLTKQVLAPPYIYLLFNFILFCILSSSFWSTSFKSLLKTIHSFLSIFQSAASSNIATTTTYNNHEQAFLSYFTRQTSTLFENFNWGCNNNISHKEVEVEEEEEEVTNSALHYNRTLPFDGVTRVIKHTEDSSTWFSPGNDHNIYDGFPQKNSTSSSCSKDEDANIGMKTIQYTDTSNISFTDMEDEEIKLMQGDEVGNDMDSTWKAIMEGKKNKLMMEDQKRLTAESIPRQQPAPLDPPASQLNYSERSSRDNKLNPVKRCPPPTPPQFRRGSGEASGEKKQGGGGWKRNMMEEFVTGQDELYHRAEAFINRFKNGIQLQRRESYQRFLEIINR